jgi:hypothetical protein
MFSAFCFASLSSLSMAPPLLFSLYGFAATFALNPMPRSIVRFAIISVIPLNAPPHINNIFLVSI